MSKREKPQQKERKRKEKQTHLVQDGSTIIGDNDIAICRRQHLVHTSRTKACAHSIRHRLGSQNVGISDIILPLCIYILLCFGSWSRYLMLRPWHDCTPSSPCTYLWLLSHKPTNEAVENPPTLPLYSYYSSLGDLDLDSENKQKSRERTRRHTKKEVLAAALGLGALSGAKKGKNP